MNIALVRRQTIVVCGLLVILRLADAVFVHAAELILRRRIALGRGFAVPGQDLCIIQCHVACPKIVIREGELRLGVSRSGGLVNIRGGRLRKQQ